MGFLNDIIKGFFDGLNSAPAPKGRRKNAAKKAVSIDEDYKNYDKLLNMLEKYGDMVNDACSADDPRKAPEKFAKAEQYLKKMKSFSETIGQANYFNESFMPDVRDFIQQYESYMANEHEQEVAEYLELQSEIAEKKKQKKSLEKKMLIFFDGKEQVMQKELLKDLTDDEKKLAKKIIDDWIAAHKISKSKNESGHIMFTVINVE